MNGISKALAGSFVAGAMALSAVAPAFASDGHGQNRMAVSVTVGSNQFGGDYDFIRAGYRDWDGRYGDNGYRGGWNVNPRQAVQMCTSRAEAMASRRSYGRANVTDVRDVRNTGWGGFEIRGRIAVNSMGHGWRMGDNRYGYGWNNDYRGWHDGLRGYDSGRFTCRVERGRVVDIDFDGIRGL